MTETKAPYLTRGSIYHQWVSLPDGNAKCSQCGNYEDRNVKWHGYCPAYGTWKLVCDGKETKL